MYAWQFCKALYLADLHGWTRFVSMQNHYNLLYREEEREMMGLCAAEGIGVIPWSPLARGRLTRPWDQRGGTERAASDEFGKKLYAQTEDADRLVVERVRRGGQRARSAARANRTGLDLEQAVRDVPDHRRDETESSGRRGRRFVDQAGTRGSRPAGGAVRAPSRRRVFVTN